MTRSLRDWLESRRLPLLGARRLRAAAPGHGLSAAPGRLTWLLLAGLIAIYAGERIVAQIVAARWVLTGVGSALVLAVTALRFSAWRAARDEARALARLFALATAGCALAALGFLLVRPVGDALAPADGTGPHRAGTALVVLSAILLAVSLLTLLAAQWAGGADRRAPGETGAIDRLRVSRIAAAGATVAVAGAFLMLTGYVASARDATLDFSYFKTSSPGSAAVRITESMGSPLRVLLFFPPANEVGDQVRGYFRALAAGTDNVRIAEHDRLAAPALAEQHGVTEDGTVVLATGDRTERLTLPVDIGEARVRLRELDQLVQQMLMRIARERRTVYLTVGHGELNDPKSADPVTEAPYGGVEALRSLFGLLNYQVQELGIHNGLGQAVPGDAAMVVVLGPRRPFFDAELQALDRYLAAGGAALFALEPGTGFGLGALEQRLGVAFRDVPLADDVQHLRQHGNLADRQLIITDRFSSHAALSTLGQAGSGSGIALLGAGHLATDLPGSRATVLVRSLPSTFADLDRDFEPDATGEARESYPLVAAVEGDVVRDSLPGDAAAPGDSMPAGDSTAATAGGAGDVPGPAMRALVFADADLFSDAVVTSLGLNAALAADAVRWLGGEEQLSGETHSEEDVPIVHTQAEDVGWFYATIFGMPALVLAAGLFGVRRRRRTSAPGREV